MKKIKLFLITIFILFLGINNTNAMSLKVTGTTSGKKGEEVTLYVRLERTENEKTISAVDGKLNYDESVLELISATSLMQGWTEFSGISNGKTFAYGNLTFDKLITETSKDIAKLEFKIKNNTTSGFTPISITLPNATDENGNAVSISGGKLQFRVLSDVNTLSGITVSKGDLDFSEDKTEYNLTVEEDNITIGATQTDTNSTISGDIGTKELNYGLNKFKITVTSESGIQNVYTINVTRTDNRNTINTLENIILSDGNIKFSKDTTNYNIAVGKTVNEIKVDAILSDETSSFITGYGPRTVELKTGENIIDLKVQAENEEIKVYRIKVTKEDPRSDNSFLSKITLSEGKITFDKEILEYEITVLYEVEKIDVKVELEDSKSTYEIIGNDKLKVGDNLITITVTAENESTTEYKIKVVRKEESESLSNNSKLSSLIIDGYSINFSPTKYEYTIKINEETQLNIHYKADDKGSVVTVKGNENLENGSVIIVKVTAEDGTETEYKIVVAKSESNMLLFIIIGAAILVIIIVTILIITKKKPKSSNKETLKEIPVNNIDEIPVIQNIKPQIQPVTTNVMTTPPIQQVVPPQTVNTTQNAPFFGPETSQNVQNIVQQPMPQATLIQQQQQQVVQSQPVQNNQNFTN